MNQIALVIFLSLFGISTLGLFVLYSLRFYDLFKVGDSPYVPLNDFALEELIKYAKVRAGQTIYELGSGDGRVVLRLSQAMPKTNIIGVEKGYWPWLMAQLRWLLAGRPKNVHFLRRDIREVSLRDASLVFVYLMDDFLAYLMPKFRHELRPGTALISCQFKLSGKRPVQTVPIPHSSRIASKLYIYKF